jgi:hypothetical protein
VKNARLLYVKNTLPNARIVTRKYANFVLFWGTKSNQTFSIFSVNQVQRKLNPIAVNVLSCMWIVFFAKPK